MSELAPGTAAPRATLPRLGGGSLAIPGDAPLTLLAFWKASCPTCAWALPFVQNLHAATAGGSLAVLGVAEDEEAEARRAADALGLTFPQGVESAPWELSEAYRLLTVPTFVLVDADGRIAMTSPGFAKEDLLEVARRAAALDGVEPADPFRGEDVPAFRPG